MSLFSFDASKGETPQSLRAKREIAQALISARAPARNVGEGLGQLGNAIAFRLMQNKIDKGQADVTGQAHSAMSPIIASLFGNGGPQPSVDAVVPPARPAGPLAKASLSDGPSVAANQSNATRGQPSTPGEPSAIVDALRGGQNPEKFLRDTRKTLDTNGNWLQYANKGAIRDKPISPKLAEGFSFLPEMGISMQVFSGGQDGKGEGNRRTGSIRHDHGDSADVLFIKDGRKLDWGNQADIPVLQEIVSRSRANGVTGFGAGDGYMQQGSMHVGFGTPAVWGAGGKGENAPDWLRQAFNTKYQPSPTPQAPVQVASNDAPSAFQAAAPQQQVKPAGGGRPQLDAATLMQAMTNPAVQDNPQMMNILDMLLKQEMQKRDPAYQMQMQGQALDQKYKQAQIENLSDGDVVSVGGRLVNRKTGQVVYDPPQDVNDQNEYGLNPIYGKDSQGNLVIMQPSKQGGVKQVDLPKGVSLAPGIDYLNTGTGFVPVDKRGGVVPENGNVAPVPIDVTGKARADEVGAAQGKAEVAAPGDIAAADNALDLLSQIENNSYLDRGTGLSSLANSVPGSGGYDFQNVVDQAKSGAFLTAIQQMRGLGSLSNAEGDVATRAVTRINTSTSKEAFLKAVNDYKSIILQGKSRAQKRLGIAVDQPSAQSPERRNPVDLKQKYGLE
jgi:hypothetical protein